MWCLLLILFPIALVFSESSMSNLQSVSIVAAFPIGIVILMIVAGFLEDAGGVSEGKTEKNNFLCSLKNRSRFLFLRKSGLCAFWK